MLKTTNSEGTDIEEGKVNEKRTKRKYFTAVSKIN